MDKTGGISQHGVLTPPALKPHGNLAIWQSGNLAIWQFDLFIVPREGFMPWRSSDGYEVSPLPESLAQLANTLLTQKLGNSWLMLDDWWIFGEEQGNRVDLSLYETGDAGLHARH